MQNQPAHPQLVPLLRRTALLFVPLCAALVGIVLVLHQQDLAGEFNVVATRSKDIVALHAKIIDRELSAISSDVRYFSEQPELRRFLTNGEGREALEAELVRLCRERDLYDQARVIDLRGFERIRVNYREGDPRAVPKELLQDKSSRYYFGDALGLARGEVFRSPFDLNIEHGVVEEPWRPVIRFATPVFDEADQRAGLLVLNFRGASLLSELQETSAHAPGVTLLIDGAGNYLRGMEPERAWGFMFDQHYTLQSDFPEIGPLLVNPSGQLSLEQGLLSFQHVRPPDLSSPRGTRAGLTVASFVPTAVLRGHSRLQLRRLGGVTLLACLLLLAPVS
ncbi:MAG: cache domain-containing protein, partial [Myxococcota bacterium]|nr:cache domain-containing protein [Myxococcota bacterium]